MSFALWELFAIAAGYLLLLFLIAYAAERQWLPARWVSHPITYTLSLGVYATSWSFYGSVGFASEQGYNFLTIYLGVTLAFLLGPVLLAPILRLTRDYQLSSLADLFAFRYRSQAAGVLVTLFMLAGTLPYIALQIRAVTESLQILSGQSTPSLLALGFCLTVTLFAVLFGARHSSARERHEGLVAAIAFESLIKLVALLAVGGFALYGVFGGPLAMQGWLEQNPEALTALYRPVREGHWATLLVLAFAAAFLLPRQFHMAFTENLRPAALETARWAFPLYLLLLNLAVPVILWAGGLLQPEGNPDYFVLALGQASDSPWLAVLVFLGGLSAASAMIIVTTLALAAMSMNHLLLPVSFPRRPAHGDPYRWLLWGRRLVIALIILAGYGFFLLLERNQGLVQLGLISFVAVAQFLPGIIGLLYWRRATRQGFIAGLLAGAATWAYLLLLPLLDTTATDGGQPWYEATLWSLSLNGALFAVVSLLTRPDEAQLEAARACCRDTLGPPQGVMLATSVDQVEEQLARLIGTTMAGEEVRRALLDLGLEATEQNPTELRRLRERLERNLSGLVGPVLARMIVDEHLQMDPAARSAIASSVHFIEQRLEASRNHLSGLAAELDALRRYHRQILKDLPLGACSLGPAQEISSWNSAMAQLTGISAAEALGRQIGDLPSPWSGILHAFLSGDERHLRKVKLRHDEQLRVLNLHQARIAAPDEGEHGAGVVLLVEDLTELSTLEAELAHSDRLASIGQLAAGVAHEIGNPITGIDCAVQNLLSEEDDAEFRRHSLEQIREQTGRISRIVQNLITFSHAGQLDHPHQPVTIAAVVDEAIELVTLDAHARQLQFLNHCPAGLQVLGDHQALLQIFVNLLGNAADASPSGETVAIDATDNGELAEVVVSDHGSGIPESLQERVFEPFFTTKEPGEGTGLGLSLVYNLMQEHSGSLRLASHPGEGTRITLLLPLSHPGDRP